MPCYHPMQAFRGKVLTKTGKRKIVFSASSAFFPDLPHNCLTLPCGQCIGCRLERSRQWAVRCVHEASLHSDNCFITLTYSDKFVPRNMSLKVKHFQDFMKRLRKRYGSGIRFFHCGEYGEKYRRPHYHAILFNFDFDDQKFWKEENGFKLYRSASLEELWPFGHSSVGSATFESAAYVARYIMKKRLGKDSSEFYKNVDLDTGLVTRISPEYTTMSRRPGIGKSWYDSFKDDVYPRDEIVLRNKKMRPPKYYDSMFEFSNPSDFENLKVFRKRSAAKFKDNQTPERLAVREKVKKSQIIRLVRNFEKGDL